MKGASKIRQFALQMLPYEIVDVMHDDVARGGIVLGGRGYVGPVVTSAVPRFSSGTASNATTLAALTASAAVSGRGTSSNGARPSRFSPSRTRVGIEVSTAMPRDMAV